MEATTPELGPVGFWSQKSSSLSCSDSIVVEEAARNFQSPRPSINKSRSPNFFIQHDKVEASKLRCYLEACGHIIVSQAFFLGKTMRDVAFYFILQATPPIS